MGDPAGSDHVLVAGGAFARLLLLVVARKAFVPREDDPVPQPRPALVTIRTARRQMSRMGFEDRMTLGALDVPVSAMGEPLHGRLPHRKAQEIGPRGEQGIRHLLGHLLGGRLGRFPLGRLPFFLSAALAQSDQDPRCDQRLGDEVDGATPQIDLLGVAPDTGRTVSGAARSPTLPRHV